MSEPVAGVEPMYGEAEADPDSEWIVLAACSPTGASEVGDQVAFGVLNNADVTVDVRNLIVKHAYDRYLGECGGSG